MNEPKAKEWIQGAALLDDFLLRHQISPVRVEEAQVLHAAKVACRALWPNWREIISIQAYREPEIVIAVDDPLVAGEVRMASLSLVERIHQELKMTQNRMALRVRVIGGSC